MSLKDEPAIQWQRGREAAMELITSLEWLTATRSRTRSSALIPVAIDCVVSFPEKFTSYAGILAHPSGLRLFQHSWDQILERSGLPYFRMADATTLTGTFVSWTSKPDAAVRRDALVGELVELVRDHELLRVFGATAETGALSTPEERASGRKSVFDRLIGELLEMPSDEPKPCFAILCDRFQDMHALFERWLEHLQQDSEIASARVSGLSVLNGKQVPGLQAANMVAFLLRQEAERKVNEPKRRPNPLLERVMWEPTTRGLSARGGAAPA